MSCPSKFNCADCDTARARPTWGAYRVTCFGCRARGLARSMAAREAIVDSKPEALQEAINKSHDDPLVRAEFKRAIWTWWNHDHPQQRAAAPKGA